MNKYIPYLFCALLLAAVIILFVTDNNEKKHRLDEKITLRRFARYAADDGNIGSYVHGRKIGVLVEMSGGDETLGRDIAMHIAASRPE